MRRSIVPKIAPRIAPAILPGDEPTSVDDTAGADVGAGAANVLWLVINSTLVIVTVAVFDIVSVVRVVRGDVGAGLLCW